jgi:hypothetical protein
MRAPLAPPVKVDDGPRVRPGQLFETQIRIDDAG